MKKYSKIIALILFVLALCAISISALVPFNMEETEEALLKIIITRIVCFVCFLFALIYFGYFSYVNRRLSGKSLLLCLPFVLIALNNFPYTAYFSGQITLDFSAVKLVLLIFSCICVGLFEEVAFRGLITVFLIKRFGHNKWGLVKAILLSSVIFALIHLINLLENADVGSTLMQVGYSFLIGCMLSMCLVISGNIWLCAAIHALFNFCGGLLTYFAVGGVDVATIVITAVLAALTLAYCIVYLVKSDMRRIRFHFCVIVD